MQPEFPIERLTVVPYTIPTDFPESDGTLKWDSTTIVVVQVFAGGKRGLGYSYTHGSVATLVQEKLAPVIIGKDALAVGACWRAMHEIVRNMGQEGLAATAIAAVDAAVWDLKARLLELPLVRLLGQMREAAPAYGSGGFTSYPIDHLIGQLAGWREEGFVSVKMKVGREPKDDVARVKAACQAIGSGGKLFVDANWAYNRKQAIAMADAFAQQQVVWFEEPVHHHDLEGLRLVRDRAPAVMEISAGEYGYSLLYFRQLLESQAVDVLQADATRFGISGFLRVAELCLAHHIPISSHTAPALHVHVCCAVPHLRNMEYFHDHVRIEHMLFDGLPEVRRGTLVPDLSRPGIGLELKEQDAERWREVGK